MNMDQSTETELKPANLSDLQAEFTRIKHEYPAAFSYGFLDHWGFLDGKDNMPMNRYTVLQPVKQMLWAEGARIAAQIHVTGDFGQLPHPDDVLTEKRKNPTSEDKRVITTGKAARGGPVRMMRVDGGAISISQGVS